MLTETVFLENNKIAYISNCVTFFSEKLVLLLPTCKEIKLSIKDRKEIIVARTFTQIV